MCVEPSVSVWFGMQLANEHAWGGRGRGPAGRALLAVPRVLGRGRLCREQFDFRQRGRCSPGGNQPGREPPEGFQICLTY